MGRRKKTSNQKKKNSVKKPQKFKHAKPKNDRCVNPYNLEGHVGRYLRRVPRLLLSKFHDIHANDKICNKCRKYGNKLGKDQSNVNDIHDDQHSAGRAHASANEGFGQNHEANLESDSSDTNREQPIGDDSISEHIVVPGVKTTDTQTISSPREEDYKIMFEKLREKFSECAINDPLRIQILTLVPDSWTLQKTADEFQTSIHFARKARELRRNEGVFGKVHPKQGKVLSPETEKKIKDFYTSDENSRVMPSTKDTVSMKVNGLKQKVQKRLLLLSLKELYHMFKQENPNVSVGFSTFAKNRPKNCILPGQSGTHSVCVCTIHQNVKTMLDAIDLKTLTANEKIKLTDYKDCLKQMVCSSPTEKCFLNECQKCPSAETFTENLRQLLIKASINEVRYAVWTETDRATLVIIQESVDDYIENLAERFESLKPHSFIVKKQSEYIKLRKSKLGPGEVMVCFDFSENYAFVAQDAAQAFHYNNDQSTVFPVVYYFQKGSEIVHKSCIFLSESTRHDSAAVHTVLNQLIPEIKNVVPKLSKVIYVSDGAKQHFKNRFQMSNLLQHKNDFGVEAEWHFTPTAHGKGAHDGLAASFKREARRASLKAKPTDALLDVKSLFNWARKYFSGVKIFYFSEVDHNRFKRKLNARFGAAERVNGITKHHRFCVAINGTLEMKRFSVIT